MNTGPFANLIFEFDKNWRVHAPDLAMSIRDDELDLWENHPLKGEMACLCSGRSASLPFFRNNEPVIWCTLAPDNDSLRQAVGSLNAWVIPSFGGTTDEDGYVHPDAARGALASLIKTAAPEGYFRWRCPRENFSEVIEKLRLFRSLESIRPRRSRAPRPSLYELRARFATALLVGDRDRAEEIIQLLDSLQLETAVNTQFMRIRLWYHFREFDKIRFHPDLPHLLDQTVPAKVRFWIDEALGNVERPSIPSTQAAEISVSSPVSPPLETPSLDSAQTSGDWVEWFAHVKQGNREGAEVFIQERPSETTLDIPFSAVSKLAECIEDLYLDETVRSREHGIILEGIANLLQEFVLEPQFPRPALGSVYFALLQLWSSLHAGISGQEHGSVLLELASAVLRLNRDQKAVCDLLEAWWKARPVPSQLPYVLDAIELLDRETTDQEATANLWLSAANTILRSRDLLSPSDKELWRRTGMHLGFSEADIAQYLPPEVVAAHEDLLSAANLSHIAIVCLREQQANEAAKAIRERTNARVTTVTSENASGETKLALNADVVLFVWMASTHAVFRAFDNYERKRFCYVQGTGASSIVRTLERWVMANYSCLNA